MARKPKPLTLAPDPYQVHNVRVSTVFLVGAAHPADLDPATLHRWGIGWAEAEAAADLARWEGGGCNTHLST